MCRELLDRLPEDEQAEAVAAGEELAGALVELPVGRGGPRVAQLRLSGSR